MQVSVVVPAFDEAEAVAGVVGEIRKVLEDDGLEHEIIVVDDGSSDATAEEAASAGARVIRNPTNKGYGYSLLRGIETAAYDLVAITDADGTYPADALPQLIKESERYDMVVGRRTGSHYKGGILKRTSRTIFRLMAEFACGTKIPDVNSGMRVFRRGFIAEHRGAFSTGYSFTTTVTLIAFLEGLHISYVPIGYGKRTGSSKVRWLRDTLRSVQLITEAILLYNPLKVFILLAMVPVVLIPVQVLADGLSGFFGAGFRLAYAFRLLTYAVSTSCVIFALGCVGFVVSRAGRRDKG